MKRESETKTVDRKSVARDAHEQSTPGVAPVPSNDPAEAAEQSFRITGLDKEAYEFLTTCRKIHEVEHGSTTPIEGLIDRLVSVYQQRNGGVRPGDVQNAVEEFEIAYDIMERDVKHW